LPFQIPNAAQMRRAVCQAAKSSEPITHADAESARVEFEVGQRDAGGPDVRVHPDVLVVQIEIPVLLEFIVHPGLDRAAHAGAVQIDRRVSQLQPVVVEPGQVEPRADLRLECAELGEVVLQRDRWRQHADLAQAVAVERDLMARRGQNQLRSDILVEKVREIDFGRPLALGAQAGERRVLVGNAASMARTRTSQSWVWATAGRVSKVARASASATGRRRRTLFILEPSDGMSNARCGRPSPRYCCAATSE